GPTPPAATSSGGTRERRRPQAEADAHRDPRVRPRAVARVLPRHPGPARPGLVGPARRRGPRPRRGRRGRRAAREDTRERGAGGMGLHHAGREVRDPPGRRRRQGGTRRAQGEGPRAVGAPRDDVVGRLSFRRPRSRRDPRRLPGDAEVSPHDWSRTDRTLVRYEPKGGIAVLTMEDPPANGYSYPMMRQIDEAVLRARFDDDVHVIVFRGAGDRFFSAGADMRMLTGA